MGYFNTTYYNSLMHADVKRNLNGTSISKEKGTDNNSSSDTSSSNGSESAGASSSGKWYTKYNDRIKDAKAAKAQKEAQEAEAKKQKE